MLEVDITPEAGKPNGSKPVELPVDLLGRTEQQNLHTLLPTLSEMSSSYEHRQWLYGQLLQFGKWFAGAGSALLAWWTLFGDSVANFLRAHLK